MDDILRRVRYVRASLPQPLAPGDYFQPPPGGLNSRASSNSLICLAGKSKGHYGDCGRRECARNLFIARLI